MSRARQIGMNNKERMLYTIYNKLSRIEGIASKWKKNTHTIIEYQGEWLDYVCNTIN